MLDGLERMPKLLGSLHAAEHAMIALLPLWAMCDRWDIGGLSTNVHFQTGRPTIFVYDGHPGGVGITARGFEAFEGWVADTGEDDRGLPVRARLPVVRPVAEVRQPERHARQGGRARAAQADARGLGAGGEATSTGHGAFASTWRTVRAETGTGRTRAACEPRRSRRPPRRAPRPARRSQGPASRARTLRARRRTPKESAIASALVQRTCGQQPRPRSMRASSGSSGEISITKTAMSSAPCSAASEQAISTARADSAPEIGTSTRL